MFIYSLLFVVLYIVSNFAIVSIYILIFIVDFKYIISYRVSNNIDSNYLKYTFNY